MSNHENQDARTGSVTSTSKNLRRRTIRMARVALLVEEGFEDLELWYPKLRLIEAGHEALVVTPDGKPRSGKHGYPANPDLAMEALDIDSFDALVVPGGSRSPELLRTQEEALELVRGFKEAGKPIASICHGPWLLASAGILAGRTVTCYFAIRDDVANAGATYEDAEVVEDGNLVTSRTPNDLPAFMRAFLGNLG
jgi:protease I